MGNFKNITSAYIVYQATSDMAWLNALTRPGYRHCYFLYRTDRHWYTMDSLFSGFLFEAHYDIDTEFDLAQWSRDQGHNVDVINLDATPAHKPLMMPLGLFTCVECIKRILNLRTMRVQTPYQLHRHLVYNGYANILEE